MPALAATDAAATLAAAEAARRSRGLMLMLLGVLLFTIMDVIAKLLTATYPVTETIFLRQILAIPILLVALHRDVGILALGRAQHGMQMLRSLFGFATGAAFFTAISVMPLANVLAITFTSPLIVVLLSMPLLGERVGRESWIALALGLVGVLIVVRPDQGLLDPMAVIALLSAFTYAISIVLLRRLGGRDPATVSAFYGTMMAIPLSGVWALGGDWLWPSLAHWPLFGIAATLGAFATLAIASAFRLAPAALLAPMDYTSLIWATGLGWVMFGDVPGAGLLVGAALIILGGLALTRRPRRGD